MPRVPWSAPLAPALAALALAAAGCNQGLPAGGLVATPGADLAGAPDLGSPPPPDLSGGAPSETYPATFPSPPQVESAGGPTLRDPGVVPVFFSNDDPATVAQVVDFLARVGATSYWKATTSEYGVGPAVATAPVMLAEAAPRTIDDSAIQKWLLGKLNGDDPAFPPADKNSIYALQYPNGTTITLQGSRSCSSFGGYHSEVRLDATHKNLKVAYTVVPRCAKGIDTITEPLSHELIEAATDPYPFSAPAYSSVDGDHVYWMLVLGGSELGDMCQANRSSYTKFPELPYAVQRSWSNAAAQAGHDPCVPVPAGEVYFAAVPDLPDAISIAGFGQTFDTVGVAVPVGTRKTIDLLLISDADTGGPFDVSVTDVRPNQAFLEYALDRQSGRNGERLHLTISSVNPSPRGSVAFAVRASLGNASHTWYGEVSQD